MSIEWTEVNEARLGALYSIPRSQRTEADDVELADLRAREVTFEGDQKRVRAETAKAEIEAMQGERAKIVEDVKDWVKFCKKLGCGVITVDAESLTTARVITELATLHPNILDRVTAAKGLALQFKPADATSDAARALVIVPGTKVTAKRGSGDGGNRGGKLIALWDKFATAEERAALEAALVPLRAKGARLDSVENKHRVDVKKRLLKAEVITPE